MSRLWQGASINRIMQQYDIWDDCPSRRSTCVEKGFGVTSRLSSEESHKGSGQASTAAHNVIPGLPRPLHVIKQLGQQGFWGLEARKGRGQLHKA
ncbi:MAG: hypothetical protein FRX49_01711 [Trebouxia sp. A1-2]|nr:MAG: hypothetical protein FRX49_01711 [Trebouxia sp. A1-2]